MNLSLLGHQYFGSPLPPKLDGQVQKVQERFLLEFVVYAIQILIVCLDTYLM